MKNIITQQILTSECTEALLNIFENGCKFYQEFFVDRFVAKLKDLSYTIPKIKLTTFKALQQETSSEKKLAVAKQNQAAQRIIEIAKERKFDSSRLCSFELTQINPLFDEDGSLKESSEVDLVTELEKLAKDHAEYCENVSTVRL